MNVIPSKSTNGTDYPFTPPHPTPPPRYLEVLLRKVSAGDIVFSPTHLAFISLPSENTLSFDAQDYADIIGLSVALL